MSLSVALKVLTCIVVLVTFALSVVLFGYLCSECFSCDKKEHVQKLANSFFWVALSVSIFMFILLIFGVYKYVTNKSRMKNVSIFMVILGCLIGLALVTALAGVVMTDVKKSLELFSCVNRISSSDDGYVPFKRARGVCIAAMVLLLIVLITTVFSLARELAPKAMKLLNTAKAKYAIYKNRRRGDNWHDDGDEIQGLVDV